MPATHTTSGGRLVLRTSLGEIPRLAAWVDDVARQTALRAETVFAIQLCLEEAIANVIMYGDSPEDSPISVELGFGNDGATAVIEDRGRPFDPTALPPRIKPTSLDDSKIGELGVHLIRNYSRTMRYQRVDGCNRLTLTFETTSSGVQA